MCSELQLRGLSQWEILAEKGPLANVVAPLAKTQIKNLRNDCESGCG